VLKRIKSILSGKRRVDYAGVRRNDDCPCGSGRKFKQCCIDKVEKKARAQRDAALFGSRKG
jgi:uncharacterized protein YchJ